MQASAKNRLCPSDALRSSAGVQAAEEVGETIPLTPAAGSGGSSFRGRIKHPQCEKENRSFI